MYIGLQDCATVWKVVTYGCKKSYNIGHKPARQIILLLNGVYESSEKIQIRKKKGVPRVSTTVINKVLSPSLKRPFLLFSKEALKVDPTGNILHSLAQFLVRT
jgi:hypothetical protein